ncbi:MAG: iron chaperone [Clostridiaceae bacterium]
MNAAEYKNIDEYIDMFSPEVQIKLKQLRRVIQEAAPGAAEKISYKMPAFDYFGILVYFAAFKNHIGFYPTPSGIEAFSKELAVYKTAKGSVQFPLEEPLPYNLIADVVKFRVAENLMREEDKKTKKEKR